MPLCVKCGASFADAVTCCPQCGLAQGTTPAAATPAGLGVNGAGLLAYVFGWITGLIFFLIDKRPFVRFHAMQSIITFGALIVIQWILVWSGWLGGVIG